MPPNPSALVHAQGTPTLGEVPMQRVSASCAPMVHCGREPSAEELDEEWAMWSEWYWDQKLAESDNDKQGYSSDDWQPGYYRSPREE